MTSGKPTHFIHGESDELIAVADLRALYARVSPPKTLTIVDDANHLFEGRVAEVGEAIRHTFAINPKQEEHA